jgi:hypothetical protein
MKNSFIYQYLSAMSLGELDRFELYLQSPYHNTRADTFELFMQLRTMIGDEAELPTKEAIFTEIYPDKGYSNLKFNNLLAYLTASVRSFFALENWKKTPELETMHLLYALRDHQMDHQFERIWQNQYTSHLGSVYRNAHWYMQEYQLQHEYFKYKAMKERSWPDNLEATTNALTTAFALETLRWNSTVIQQKNATGKSITLPLTESSRQFLSTLPDTPGTYALFQQSNVMLEKTGTIQDFQDMRSLMRKYIHTLSQEEKREIYLSAINFCIRQINQGDRSFMKEAFTLYQEALESRALLDRDAILQTHTYYNVHVLAHRLGERAWAKTFLDRYQEYLPKGERKNFYQYNLAIFSFMLEDYQSVLGTLIHVQFNELYLNLEVRLMMLRAYFETKQWNSLDSLMASFSLFVRRHKELGANKDRYLNLIKFTKKLLKIHTIQKPMRLNLLKQAQQTQALSDKEWVIKKLEESCGIAPSQSGQAIEKSA